MRTRLPLIAVLLVALGLTAGAARAILGGQPDGTAHPYVGLENNGVFTCSGTLLSPTVMLTAAHCFSDSTSAFGTAPDGAPIVRVSFDPDLAHTAPADRVWHFGLYYFDPQFALGTKGGLPGFDTHDVALIIFGTDGCSVPANATGHSSCGPVSSPSYGQLPASGLVDTLKNKTPIDIVGYGVQDFLKGGGPCGGPCKPTDGDSLTRFVGQTTLVAANDRISDEFIKERGNNAGTCFGDSGGPNLLGGTSTVLAVTSFGTSPFCKGNGYSYRVDTPAALDWITTTASDKGGHL